MDRRGFFASIGASLLAPLVPLVPKKNAWIFSNASKVSFYPAVATLKSMDTVKLVKALETPLRMGAGAWSQDEMGKIFTPIESTEGDPFQTFQVDTDHV
jgi:hypothetical protein